MKRAWWFFVFVVLTICIVFYLWQRPKNYFTLANKIDIKINKVFVGFGITDENITKNLRIQKITKTAKWVQFVKDIKTDIKIEDIVTEIKVSISEFGVEINYDGLLNTILVTKDGNILNKIFFLEREAIKFKAVIIIDDVGYKKDELEDFLSLGIPLTFSILPFEKYSNYHADELKKQSHEFLLHQPMESEGYPKINPGKASILISMTADEIKKKVLSNLGNVEGATGINNHMGSAFTCNKTKMEEFLEVVCGKNLIFVDSFTSPKSVACETANAMGVASLQNEVFLDNEDNLEYILKQLALFKKKIKKYGGCVAIGHVHRKNLCMALSKIIPEFQKEGITFLTVSQY